MTKEKNIVILQIIVNRLTDALEDMEEEYSKRNMTYVTPGHTEVWDMIAAYKTEIKLLEKKSAA